MLFETGNLALPGPLQIMTTAHRYLFFACFICQYQYANHIYDKRGTSCQ